MKIINRKTEIRNITNIIIDVRTIRNSCFRRTEINGVVEWNYIHNPKKQDVTLEPLWHHPCIDRTQQKGFEKMLEEKYIIVNRENKLERILKEY